MRLAAAAMAVGVGSFSDPERVQVCLVVEDGGACWSFVCVNVCVWVALIDSHFDTNTCLF